MRYVRFHQEVITEVARVHWVSEGFRSSPFIVLRALKYGVNRALIYLQSYPFLGGGFTQALIWLGCTCLQRFHWRVGQAAHGNQQSTIRPLLDAMPTVCDGLWMQGQKHLEGDLRF